MSRPGSLQEEIRQRKPFASPQQEAFLALLRTADRVRRRQSAIVEPKGITLQQYNVLRILRGAGPDGLPTLEIAERMIEEAPGITRLLDRLEKKKWIVRRRRKEDRRRVFCYLTPSGNALLSSLDAPVAAGAEAALALLSPDEVRTLIALLERVRQAP
jgi:DNA-binding MarR family transcriptional regulator